MVLEQILCWVEDTIIKDIIGSVEKIRVWKLDLIKKYCISVQFPEVDSYTEDILVFRKYTVKHQGVKRHAV